MRFVDLALERYGHFDNCTLSFRGGEPKLAGGITCRCGLDGSIELFIAKPVGSPEDHWGDFLPRRGGVPFLRRQTKQSPGGADPEVGLLILNDAVDRGAGKAIADGEVVCRTVLVNRGKRVAYMESSVYCGELLLARASGTYAIFKPSKGAA